MKTSFAIFVDGTLFSVQGFIAMKYIIEIYIKTKNTIINILEDKDPSSSLWNRVSAARKFIKNIKYLIFVSLMHYLKYLSITLFELCPA